MNADRYGHIGYLLEVDIEIPEDIHQLTDDLPLAPESKAPEFISGYMEKMWIDVEGNKKYRGNKKLLLTHFPKKNYVIHFALLQFYKKKFHIKITNVHRIVQYEQAPIFKRFENL